MDIFQNLPRDIALQCLIRVPFNQFHSFESVCKTWKNEIEFSELLGLRKSTGKAQSLVVLSQARVNTTTKGNRLNIPEYRLVVLELETGCWSEMPPLSGFANGLPLFCEIVAIGTNLVVMGGYDPRSWECLSSVFVFDFLSSTWRRGNDMPGGPRSFFGCASDGDRTVCVMGGHDLEKNALKSTWKYDVATDKWTQLADMAKERDECKGLFHGGKFHVIGGYPTNAQGDFQQNIESFDMTTTRWTESDYMFSNTIHPLKNCVVGMNDKVYARDANDVVVLEDGLWEFVAKLPADVSHAPYLMASLGHILLIGASKYDRSNYAAYKMDLNERIWKKIEVPTDYCSHVQSGCCVII